MSELNFSKVNEIVWITLINNGYVNYAKNFMKSMKKANVSFKLVIYCTDDDAMSALSGYAECICIRVDFLKHSVDKDMKCWGDIEYKRLVFAKLDAILYTLKNTYDAGVKVVGYIDTDIFLFKDPSEIMLDAMNNNPEVDIFSQCDESGICCSNKNNCSNICSGVMVFRNKKELYPLLEYKDEDIISFTPFLI